MISLFPVQFYCERITHSLATFRLTTIKSCSCIYISYNKVILFKYLNYSSINLKVQIGDDRIEYKITEYLNIKYLDTDLLKKDALAQKQQKLKNDSEIQNIHKQCKNNNQRNNSRPNLS